MFLEIAPSSLCILQSRLHESFPKIEKNLEQQLSSASKVGLLDKKEEIETEKKAFVGKMESKHLK